MNKKSKSPDLTRFGFYLYPKVYRNSMGFDKAQGLLFLDSSGRIDSDLAKEIGLVRLLNSASAVLYAINPFNGRYPNSTELLNALSLGSVAKQRLITKAELIAEFLDQCAQCNIIIDLLDRSVRIGVNKHGSVVYESKSGRYIIDEKGDSCRDVPAQELLYAVNDEGELVEDMIEYCLESLFKFHLSVDNNDLDYIDAGDFNAFVHTIVRRPPDVLPKINGYTPISFYGESDSTPIGGKVSKIIDTLEKLEAKLMLDFDFHDDEAFRTFFYHIYNRKLPSTQHGFKPNLPAPLLITLLKLLHFNLIEEPHIFCPSLGSVALLAGLTNLSSKGAKITVCERLVDKQNLFNDFLHELDIKGVTVHSDTTISGFDGNISFLSLGNEAGAVNIPNSNDHTYKRSLSQMIDLLERRSATGRSVFISPVDSEGSLGFLDDDSKLFISHLYQNYQNVLIFDCSSHIALPSRHDCEYRIFIIGDYIEDYASMSNEGLTELVENPRIHIVDTAEDFHHVCDRYSKEIAAVEISSVDLMDNLMDIVNDDDSKEDAADNAPSTAGETNEVVSLEKEVVALGKPQVDNLAATEATQTVDDDTSSDKGGDGEDTSANEGASGSEDSESDDSSASGSGNKTAKLNNNMQSSVVNKKPKKEDDNPSPSRDSDAKPKPKLDAIPKTKPKNNIILIGGDDTEEVDNNDINNEDDYSEHYEDMSGFDDPDNEIASIENKQNKSGIGR